MSVIDSGPGIPKEELDTIFELFYQSNIGKKNKGSGIGLALTKELIDLHRGTIKVDSTQIEGTNFTITLPITEEAYLDTEKIMTSDSEKPIVDIEIKNENIKESEAPNLYKKNNPNSRR